MPSSTTSPPPARPAVGYRWRGAELHDKQGGLAVSASLHASIGFARNGAILLGDTGNGGRGSHTLTPTGYVVDHVELAAGGGAGPRNVRLAGAIDAMFSPRATEHVAGRGASVSAYALGDRPMLRFTGVVLTLVRDGAQPDQSSVVRPH